MNLNSLFDKKKNTIPDWNELGEELSIVDKISIFESYYADGIVLESDDHAVDYFNSLESDTPKKNHQYIVVPLLLIQNSVKVLNSDLLYLTYVDKTTNGLIFTNDDGQQKKYPQTQTARGVYKTFTFDNKQSYDIFRSKLKLKFNTELPATNINIAETREPYQLAIDKLEARRIEDLEMKMDDFAARAKESKDPKHVAALRLAFAKSKAERDEYYKLRPTVAEHGGGGGGPEQWHAYVRAHRADEGWSDAMVAQRTGGPRTPYSIYINGKKWKDFENDDHAEAVANKLRAKFRADGRDPETITIAPTDYDKGMEEGSMSDAEQHASGAKFGGYYRGTQVGAPRPGQSFGAESKEMEESAKVDRMVRHIEKSERVAGKSKKDAEAIAWATANKQGRLDNANKKDEAMNFMEWAVAQGSRFANFTSNPAVYAQAKEAFVAEGMSNALSNITRRIAQPVSAKTIIKNREQKRDSIKRQHFAEEEYDVAEDWQKANKKDKTDGMSKKAVNAYRRENPGSKLKTAVTTKPSKLKKGSKDSKRRKSYCSRSKGQMNMHNISCAKTPDKAICKARRRWNCESQEQFDAMLREAIEKGTLQPGQYYVWTVYFDDGTNKRIKVTKDNFDPKAYYAKQNKVVVNVDYSWDTING